VREEMAKPISILLLEFLERSRIFSNSKVKYKLFLEHLQSHGFPKRDLDKTIIKILKRLEEERWYGSYSIPNARKELEDLLREWQKSGGRNNATKKTF
jgi:hypothetical protein